MFNFVFVAAGAFKIAFFFAAARPFVECPQLIQSLLPN